MAMTSRRSQEKVIVEPFLMSIAVQSEKSATIPVSCPLLIPEFFFFYYFFMHG
jgi:hypothetical protein